MSKIIQSTCYITNTYAYADGVNPLKINKNKKIVIKKFVKEKSNPQSKEE